MQNPSYYQSKAAGTTAIPLSNSGALNSAFAVGAVHEVGDGVYELDCPDGMWAGAAPWVVLVVKHGATSVFVESFNLQALDSGVTPAPVWGCTVSDPAPTAGSFTAAAAGPGFNPNDDVYVGHVVTFQTGTQAGQTRTCTGYSGATGRFSFATPFPGAPGNGDEFTIR